MAPPIRGLGGFPSQGTAAGSLRATQQHHVAVGTPSSSWRPSSAVCLHPSHASTPGHHRPGRSRLQVHAALFEPPPFQPKKLSVQYLSGSGLAGVADSSSSSPGSSGSIPASDSSGNNSLPPQRCSRRYTLTHNDITGALQLSVGSDYNQRQVQGFYTRILRDEITAEWMFGRQQQQASSSSSSSSVEAASSALEPAAAAAAAASSSSSSAPAELHIYCHVSGDERWLAPPQLRNFIFRREMTLVLDTFMYGDQRFLSRYPALQQAKVYVHFQSDVQDLDLREYWGMLGDRRSWRRMPKGLLARLKLLLFGFPALPHQRPRSALTHQQQQQQQEQQQEQEQQQQAGGVAAAAAASSTHHHAAPAAAGSSSDAPLVMAAAAAAAGSSDAASSSSRHQWHPRAEQAVEATRPVALSLQEQRQAHTEQQQQAGLEQDGAQSAAAEQLRTHAFDASQEPCCSPEHDQACAECSSGHGTGEQQQGGTALAAAAAQQLEQQQLQLEQQQLQLEQLSAAVDYGYWSARLPSSSSSTRGPQRQLATATAATASSNNMLPAVALGTGQAAVQALQQQQLLSVRSAPVMVQCSSPRGLLQ